MKKKIAIAIGSVFIISLLLFTLVSQKKRALVCSIQAISPEDRIALHAFFYSLMLEEGGAYVLFGDKPAAFTAVFNLCETNFCLEPARRYFAENERINRGWKIWEKYKHLFSSDQFILDRRILDDHRFEICLIHKKNFKQTVNDNLKLFLSGTGREAAGDRLLQEYLDSDASLFQLLNQNHALLGIVLGFGTNNSCLFHKYITLGDRDPHTTSILPFKHSQSSHLILGCHPLKSAFNEINHKKHYKFLRLPYFLADPNSQETQILRSKYLKQREEIHKKYSTGNVLEVTLKRFCLGSIFF